MSAKSDKLETVLLHGGKVQHDAGTNAIVPSITTASTYTQQSLLSHGEYCYSRCGNPTRYAYETLLSDVEGGCYCTATASGVAASLLVIHLIPHGSHILAAKGVYGGTFRLLENIAKDKCGHTVDYIDLNDMEAVRQAVETHHTKLIWMESPTNPRLDLVDIARLCTFAKEYNSSSNDGQIITCVDNTFATAWNQRPISLGADIVMISSSKYIGGHSDLIGGAVVTGSSELAQRLDALKTTTGAVASPFDAYLAMRGLKTMALRMAAHCRNAQRVAEFLEGHAKVERVFYPGLPSHPQYELCQAQMRTGGGVVTIQLKGDIHSADEFVKKLKYFVLAESLGGVESMLNHSATMSHASMTPEERAAIGVYDTTLRLSVGIEDADDLIEDLAQALS